MNTESVRVTSDEINQLINMVEKFSLADYNDFTSNLYTEIKQYNSFKNKTLLHDFLAKNGMDSTDIIDSFISYNFLKINAIAKSCVGSDFDIIGEHALAHIFTFVESSDILLGDNNQEDAVDFEGIKPLYLRYLRIDGNYKNKLL